MAEVVYDVLPLPWQIFEAEGDGMAGTPTTGLIVTVCTADLGPSQPIAVAVIIEVPFHPATYVTAPVPATILFPPVKDAASRLYVIPVEFVAAEE